MISIVKGQETLSVYFRFSSADFGIFRTIHSESFQGYEAGSTENLYEYMAACSCTSVLWTVQATTDEATLYIKRETLTDLGPLED